MSDSSDDQYTLEDAKEDIDILRRVPDEVVSAIESAESEDVLEYLIEDEGIDITHDGERGLGDVRRAILESPRASDQLKRTVSLRGDDTPDDILVPNDVAKNERVINGKVLFPKLSESNAQTNPTWLPTRLLLDFLDIPYAEDAL